MSYLLFDLGKARYVLTVLFCGLAALQLNGCGSKEEPVVDTVEESAPVAEERADVAVQAVPEIPEGAPPTYALLQLMPAESQIALALPSIPGLREKVLPLLRAIAPDEDFDEGMAEAIFELADDLGVEAETYEELAEALGVDDGAPLAVFADFTRTVDGAVAAKAAYDAEQPVSGDDAEPAPVEVEEEPSDDGAEKDDSEATLEASLETPDYLDDAEEPAWILVAGLADDVKARAELERIADASEKLSALEKSTENVEGIELTIRGDYGYFISGSNLILGDLELLRGAAARVHHPAPLRYGTAACPATAADEVAMLIYGARFLPLLEAAVPLLMADMDDSALPLIQAQIEQYEGMFAQGEDEDPIVGTLSVQDDRVEMLWRTDTNINTGVLEVSGEATPLRLARYLPDNTLAMLSFRFNETFKNQLMTNILPAAQAGGSTDLAMAGQIIPQLGDELTLGITDVADGAAGIYILLGLAQPEATQGLLQMFVPMQGGTDHQGYTINPVPVPIPVPLYLSFVDDFALAGTSEAGMKSIIDLHATKGVSPLFAAMNPPFDIDIPRYQAIYLNAGLLGPALTTTAASFGGDLSGSAPVTEQITQVLREVRMGKEMEGGWMNGRISLYFQDLEALKAAREATPPSETPAQP